MNVSINVASSSSQKTFFNAAFFYRSKTGELMRNGISDMHCMSEDYLVDELFEEQSGHSMKPAPYPDIEILPLSVAEPDPPPYS